MTGGGSYFLGPEAFYFLSVGWKCLCSAARPAKWNGRESTLSVSLLREGQAQERGVCLNGWAAPASHTWERNKRQWEMMRGWGCVRKCMCGSGLSCGRFFPELAKAWDVCHTLAGAMQAYVGTALSLYQVWWDKLPVSQHLSCSGKAAGVSIAPFVYAPLCKFIFLFCPLPPTHCYISVNCTGFLCANEARVWREFLGFKRHWLEAKEINDRNKNRWILRLEIELKK